MHYYDNEYGINQKMTIQTLDPTKQKVIGARQLGENYKGVSSVSNFIIQLARFAAGCYIKTFNDIALHSSCLTKIGIR